MLQISDASCIAPVKMTTRNLPRPQFRTVFRIFRIFRILPILSLAPLLALSACATTAAVDKEAKQGDLDKMKALASKVGGTIVWTSSREGLPHIFAMKVDGSELRQLTTGDRTDWYPRLSPDGTKVLFSRSHSKGLVRQSAANAPGEWNLFTVNVDGSDPKKVVTNGVWGSWVSADEIVFVRGSQVIRAKLDGGEEAVVLDAAGQGSLASAALQQPQLSPDGKYLALTLGGGRRQVGVWKVKKQVWHEAGRGAQATWTPDGAALVWSDITGKELSSISRVAVEKGIPAKDGENARSTLLDMPGRRSHEAFPRLSSDGKWLVYASAINSAENDIEDYELFVWELGTPPEAAVRLTFNTGSDAWPDVFTGAPTASPKGEGEGEAPAAPAEDQDKAEKAEKAEKATSEETSAAPAAPEAAAEEAPAAAEEEAPPSKAKGKGKKPAPKAKKKR
jgi:Tol biopolymer transport system component